MRKTMATINADPEKAAQVQAAAVSGNLKKRADWKSHDPEGYAAACKARQAKSVEARYRNKLLKKVSVQIAS